MTLTRPDRELTLEGAFAVAGPHGSIRVSGRDVRLVAEAVDFRTVVDLLVSGPGWSWRRRTVARTGTVLARCGLTLELRVASLRLVRLGAAARPGLFSRLAGIRFMEIAWVGLGRGVLSALGSAVKRRG